MPNTETTIRRFSLRVRTEEGSTDDLRDFLHEDRVLSYPFRTFAEANAAAAAEVAQLASDLGWSSWQEERTYDEASGGGFWFVATWEDDNGDTGTVEGRVCVLVAEIAL